MTAPGSVTGLSGEAPELSPLPFGEANKVQSAACVAVLVAVGWDLIKLDSGPVVGMALAVG